MKDPNANKEENTSSSMVKYSGMGFQMLATIGLFAFIGHKIDQHQQNKKPIFTAIFSLLGVILSLYQVIKQLNKK
ncbi:F0F1-type ATP synthase assembly protein I [Pedobacter sp. CG_S7]|uniref:AtpZ/AtpI family protein n=1 Tax=Pedobacter sp. CG_S7 TaxID=3143930 RepID=UPI00339A18E0